MRASVLRGSPSARRMRTRTAPDFLREFVGAAACLGAHRIRIADTVGIWNPLQTASAIRGLRGVCRRRGAGISRTQRSRHGHGQCHRRHTGGSRKHQRHRHGRGRARRQCRAGAGCDGDAALAGIDLRNRLPRLAGLCASWLPGPRRAPFQPPAHHRRGDFPARIGNSLPLAC